MSYTHICRIAWHWLRFYRYSVADRRIFHLVLNRYPGVVIGAAVVVGRYAYCVKWGGLRCDVRRVVPGFCGCDSAEEGGR